MGTRMVQRKRQASSQNREIVRRPDYLSVPNCQFENTGLVIGENMTLEQWQQTGQFLRRIEGAVQWWVGDWLCFGEKKYGETYEKALEETDYDYITLRNMKWVSSAIEMSRRRDNLSEGKSQRWKCIFLHSLVGHVNARA